MEESASRRRLRTIDRLAADLHPSQAAYAIDNPMQYENPGRAQPQLGQRYKDRATKRQILGNAPRLRKRTIFMRFLAGAAVFLSMYSVYQAVAAMSWVTTTGIITDTHQFKSTNFIEFKYQTRAEKGSNTWHKGAEAETISSMMGEATRTVYYDPNHPDHALMHQPSVVAALFSFVFALVTFIATLKARKDAPHRVLMILVAVSAIIVLHCM